ncbi:hypothetical protein D3C87_1232660 [compost metagenome]
MEPKLAGCAAGRRPGAGSGDSRFQGAGRQCGRGAGLAGCRSEPGRLCQAGSVDRCAAGRSASARGTGRAGARPRRALPGAGLGPPRPGAQRALGPGGRAVECAACGAGRQYAQGAMAGRLLGMVAQVRLRQARHAQATGRLSHRQPTPGRRGGHCGPGAFGPGQHRRPRTHCAEGRRPAAVARCLCGPWHRLGAGPASRAMGAALCGCRHAGGG